MGWSIGYDENWERDVGYGVPAECDHPGCDKRIDRGLSYVCGGDMYGGEFGCGLYFCGEHQVGEHQTCERCEKGLPPFEPKPDVREWVEWKLTDESWGKWRDANPKEVAELKSGLNLFLPEGKILDEMVGREIFGVTAVRNDDTCIFSDSGNCPFNGSCCFSSDMGSAWLIVEKLETEGWQLSLMSNGVEWVAFFELDGKACEGSGTAPAAICRAGLNVVRKQGEYDDNSTNS